MKIAVIGAGWVGLVASACLAEMGNQVTCIDIDTKKIDALKQGHIPIHEDSLDDLLKKNKITFTTKATDADITFIAVGTPPKKDGSADLSYVEQAAKSVLSHIIVIKSTVPVGTAEHISRLTKKVVVSNPEFLREGKAVHDFLNPDRIIIGADDEKAKNVVVSLYKQLNKPIITTNSKTAELIKYASNAMLATRISFINQLASLCDELGADIEKVSEGMGLDPRIGPKFLHAGIGYGGSCFPKDIKALIHTMHEHGCKADILEAVEQANERQKLILVKKLKKELPDLKGKKIAVWGLSFKPETNDIRHAPSLTIIEKLKEEGADVHVYDPVAMEEAKKVLKGVEYGKDQYHILQDADALLIVTEWKIFRDSDMQKIKKLMRTPIIIDGRNIFKYMDGFNYHGIGR